ncbi:MAG: class I SAM-dependent methyltransferase [Hyphomicrobiales bacterium]|nr:class I SAM-dependent methyltransferase [Hyphomicrobiales bacterium]
MMASPKSPDIAHQLSLLVCDGWADYALMDIGEGRRLERFGRFLVDRPEEQAMGKRQNPALWATADAVFDAQAGGIEGRWTMAGGGPAPERFSLSWDGLPFHGRFTAFRHMGFFPEQALHWRHIVNSVSALQSQGINQPKLLNLFAYTGLASLVAARAGAHVTHVDASKRAIAHARDNQTMAGLDDKPIRWLIDDAVAFVARERRRGNSYHGIILDPPKFGRGPKGEEWELFDHLPAHLADCVELLANDGAFMVLSAYAIRASALALDDLMRLSFEGRGGTITSGELAIRTESGDRLLSTSLFSHWST